MEASAAQKLVLPPDRLPLKETSAADEKPLDHDEWRAIFALILLFIPVSLFWATYEHQGNTINIRAAAAGKIIFPMSPAKLYVPSAFSERVPEKACAISDDARGC